MSAEADLNLFLNAIVLVTGASGFIGRQLCARLLSLGANVHGTLRTGTTGPDRVTLHRLDLSDAKAVKDLIADVKPDYVFHLASRVSGSRSIEEVGPTFQSNLTSTVNLLTALTGTGCRRFVLTGSLEEVQGDVPSSPYAAAKSAASTYAHMFHRLYGTPISVARVFMVYGPGQQDTRKLVPYVSLALLGGKTPQLSSGVRPVDWVYVDDVVQALAAMAVNPETNGQTIDIGTGQLTTVRTVAETIGKLVGTMNSPVFGAIDDRPDEQVRRADPSTATRLMGRPFTDLETGLRQTVAWYCEHQPASEAPVADKA